MRDGSACRILSWISRPEARSAREAWRRTSRSQSTQLAGVAEAVKHLLQPVARHSAHDDEALQAHNGGTGELGILGKACLDKGIDKLGASLQVFSSISQALLARDTQDSTNRQLAGSRRWRAVT